MWLWQSTDIIQNCSYFVLRVSGHQSVLFRSLA